MRPPVMYEITSYNPSGFDLVARVEGEAKKEYIRHTLSAIIDKRFGEEKSRLMRQFAREEYKFELFGREYEVIIIPY